MKLVRNKEDVIGICKRTGIVLAVGTIVGLGVFAYKSWEAQFPEDTWGRSQNLEAENLKVTQEMREAFVAHFDESNLNCTEEEFVLNGVRVRIPLASYKEQTGQEITYDIYSLGNNRYKIKVRNAGNAPDDSDYASIYIGVQPWDIVFQNLEPTLTRNPKVWVVNGVEDILKIEVSYK